jgi:hypothetical protein
MMSLRRPVLSERVQGKQKAEPHNSVPVVVLAFDEAHTTTQRHQASSEEWSVFDELRHALRRLHGLPLFSLFLSTTGKILRPVARANLCTCPSCLSFPAVILSAYDRFGSRYLEGSDSLKREIIQFAVATRRNCSTRTMPSRNSRTIKRWHVYPNGFRSNLTRPTIFLKKRRGSRWKDTCEFASKLMLLLSQ